MNEKRGGFMERVVVGKRDPNNSVPRRWLRLGDRWCIDGVSPSSSSELSFSASYLRTRTLSDEAAALPRINTSRALLHPVVFVDPAFLKPGCLP